MPSDHEISTKRDEVASVVRPSVRSKAVAKRAAQRQRNAASVVRPVVRTNTPVRQSKRGENGRALAVLGFSVAIHLAVGAFALVVGTGGEKNRSTVEREIVTIREIIKPIEAPEIEPVELKPEAPPPMPQPLPQRPRPEKTKKVEPAPEPQADPVDAPLPPSEQPRRRIVGLSYESTAQGGGPAYAVGNTRMGQTEKVAADKNEAGPRVGGPSTMSPSNEVATFVPTTGKLEKPRRLSQIDLQYPTLLMARGVEGDVVVRIHIMEDGSVSTVDVVRSSGHDEFDTAARRAAMSERFAPARRSGEAVDFVLEYTYRFRLKDA
ncbi:MAG: TonB family protein [Myxococcota bacterium]|jgi:protein TonB|nr:TonB family protein [Myxococcota bacterium]